MHRPKVAEQQCMYVLVILQPLLNSLRAAARNRVSGIGALPLPLNCQDFVRKLQNLLRLKCLHYQTEVRKSALGDNR